MTARLARALLLLLLGIASVMSAMFTSGINCKYCFTATSNARNTRIHEQNHHAAAYAANSGPMSSTFQPLTPALSYCGVCCCYQEVRTASVHHNHPFHLFMASQTPVAPPLSPTHDQSPTGNLAAGLMTPQRSSEGDISETGDYTGLWSPQASTSQTDWLRSDHSIDFESSPYAGEVFVLAASDNPRVRQALALRSLNCANYGRWRVVKVEDIVDDHGAADEDAATVKKVRASSCTL